jgi:DNA-binding NtrC family response regulator
LSNEGHEVTATGSPREALRFVGERPYDLLIADNLMPELTGVELIREIVNLAGAGDRPQILMMTAHATVESAIEAMKLGALDYLQKPFEIDEFLVVVERAIAHGRLRTHRDYLITERDEQFDHYGIIGRSRAAPCSSRARRARARSWSRGPSTTGARSARCRWCASTAPHCRRRSSNRSSSATCAARSRAP